jgi:hypothetical protein
MVGRGAECVGVLSAQSRWRPSVAEPGEDGPLTTGVLCRRLRDLVVRELARAAAQRRAVQRMSAVADLG